MESERETSVSSEESASSLACSLLESSDSCEETTEGAEATVEPYQYEPLAIDTPQSSDSDGGDSDPPSNERLENTNW